MEMWLIELSHRISEPKVLMIRWGVEISIQLRARVMAAGCRSVGEHCVRNLHRVFVEDGRRTRDAQGVLFVIVWRLVVGVKVDVVGARVGRRACGFRQAHHLLLSSSVIGRCSCETLLEQSAALESKDRMSTDLNGMERGVGSGDGAAEME